MSPLKYYQEMMLQGRTSDITTNREPDYNLPFYQNIFALMRDYHLSRKALEAQEEGDKKNVYLNEDHPCFLSGHSMFLVAQKDNGTSIFGEHQCSRCGTVEPFQFDYVL